MLLAIASESQGFLAPLSQNTKKKHLSKQGKHKLPMKLADIVLTRHILWAYEFSKLSGKRNIG